jgi:hypothetical protein
MRPRAYIHDGGSGCQDSACSPHESFWEVSKLLEFGR